MRDHRRLGAGPHARVAGKWMRRAATLLVAVGGCDGALAPDSGFVAQISLAATMSSGDAVAASFVDMWQVTVARAGGEVVAEEHGPVGQGTAEITGHLSLVLATPCEVLSVAVELSAGGEVWYRAEPEHEVCAGVPNRLPVQVLDFVRPWPEISPLSLRLTSQVGQQSTASFQIRHTGLGGLNWSASVSPGADWLSLPAAGGEVGSGESRAVVVGIDATNLTPGLHEASITLSAAGFPSSVGVVLVGVSVRPSPRLSVEPVSVDLSALLGAQPEAGALTVTNAGGGVLSWTAATDVNWLVVSPSSGALGAGASAALTIAAGTLPSTPGTYIGRITIADPDALDSPRSVDVTLRLEQRAAIGLDRTLVAVTIPAGVDAPDEALLLTNPGGVPLTWTATSDAAWLTVSPTAGTLDGGGTTSTPLTLSVASAALPPGTYAATVSISDPEASNSPLPVTVVLTVDPPAPPALAGLAAVLSVLNDSTCANTGSRFDISMTYSDPNGDVPTAGGRLQGTPLTFDWQFLPDGFSGSTQLDADTSGDGFGGTLTFNLCIAFQVPQNTGVGLTYRLRDTLNQWSPPVSIVLPRPAGANTPPPAPNASIGLQVGGGPGGR